MTCVSGGREGGRVLHEIVESKRLRVKECVELSVGTGVRMRKTI